MPSKATFADIRRLKNCIKDNWSLCELFDGTPNASEAEYMVAETFHAAVINQENHGEPFSFKSAGVESRSGGGLINNGAAYQMLIDRGYFIEESRDERTVIFMTQRLIDLVGGLLAKGKVTTDA